jgi:hypothetical protein
MKQIISEVIDIIQLKKYNYSYRGACVAYGPVYGYNKKEQNVKPDGFENWQLERGRNKESNR